MELQGVRLTMIMNVGRELAHYVARLRGVTKNVASRTRFSAPRKIDFQKNLYRSYLYFTPSGFGPFYDIAECLLVTTYNTTSVPYLHTERPSFY